MLRARLSIEPASTPVGGLVLAELTVENTGSEPVTLRFATAQRLELEVGRYRWSGGRLFAAVMGELVLAPGEDWSAALEAVLDLPPGTYTARARLTAAGAPVVAEAPVTLL
jgi:hypothetical protein